MGRERALARHKAVAIEFAALPPYEKGVGDDAEAELRAERGSSWRRVEVHMARKGQ
jgi:hypothetical protein